MRLLEKNATLLDELLTLSPFRDVPREALEWLIERSDYRFYPTGTLIIEHGQPVNHMQILLRGGIALTTEFEGAPRDIGVWETGDVLGVLPFSRMKTAGAEGTVIEDAYTLELHRSYFVEMVGVSYELTQNLVALMSNRIRDYSQRRSQTEKLAGLGRMAAGLAHELNNPASAMVRNAQDLYQRVHQTPEQFKAVVTMRVGEEQVDAVNAIIYQKIAAYQTVDLTLMQRQDREEELLDWLEEQQIGRADDLAETFTDFGVTVVDLQQVFLTVGQHSVEAVLHWVELRMNMERLVAEIRESAHRIAELVTSVKKYSYMDRGNAMEMMDIHEGLKNTLVMLKHKFKTRGVRLEKDLQMDLPRIVAHPGELNQVWTNLIINALDALPNGGAIRVHTYTDREFICVEIADNGPGIPDAIQTRIFEPFFTTKKVGEGTGMGLDIVQRIVKRQKGSVTIRSDNQGSTFKVCLPFTASA